MDKQEKKPDTAVTNPASKPASRRRRPRSSASGTAPRQPATTTAASAPLPETVQAPPARRWYKVDLHMHTPASHDYEDPQISWLDWLRTVADRGLEVVAISDHNTVAGVAAIRREIEWLTKLEQQNRLTDAERDNLTAWRELSNKVLVLPAFEFTATFGFHILGIFPPETSVRTLEHILLSLRIPPEKLDLGSTETGASTDVLTAYKVIHDAGGLVIAAHANSTHGVAMRDFPFGGQTKIAYTQDVHLDALEVTDLEHRGYSTARFFNGTKSEYPRRMHCIQGSDSHRINVDPRNPKRLGIGDRASEMYLDDASFESIVSLLRSTAWDRTRPARPKDKPYDALANAREEGASIVQSFHESAVKTGGKLDAVLADICGFANTAGGTVFVGASVRKDGPAGLTRPRQVQDQILAAVEERLTPPLDLRLDTVKSSEGANILRVRVPKGEDRPYCLDGSKFYVRDEAETTLAVRDEIISMVLETMGQRSVEIAPGMEALSVTDIVTTTTGAQDGTGQKSNGSTRRGGKRGGGRKPTNGAARTAGGTSEVHPEPANNQAHANGVPSDDAFYLPQMGVEIVESEERAGSQFHTIRDLRKGTIVKSVTRKGARDLWSYAIRQHESTADKQTKIEWQGNIGLLHVEKRAGKMRYDLALREDNTVRVFYGVTEDGMEGPWSVFVQQEE